MPVLQRAAAGVTLAYEVRGAGFPVLLLAPGGMRSAMHMWRTSPYDPWAKLPGDVFKVIAMDQRNAGGSHGPLCKGWHCYRDDQLELLDHLGVGKCLIVGSCIGPSYALNLMKHSPERFPAAVFLQPIGLAPHTSEPGLPWRGLNKSATTHWFGHWANAMVEAQAFERHALASLYKSLFEDSTGHDFVFSVSRDDVSNLERQHLLIFQGKDVFHPSETAREIARLAPHAELIEQWRDERYSSEVDVRIADFLMAHVAGPGCSTPH